MRRLWIAAGCAVIVASLAVAPALIQSAPASATDSAQPSLAQCASATRGVQVQMIIDVSGSLASTDKLGRREELVQQWLTDLIGWSNQGVDVRLAIAVYGSRWSQLLDWSTLTNDSAGDAFATVGRLTKDDADTDHALAMLEASASLNEESARVEAAGSTPCTMLLWFTDGEYDFGTSSPTYRKRNGLPLTTPYSTLPVNKENRAAIMQAGVDLMCGESGPVQAMRAQNTDILAVALNLDLDFRLVEEIANGTGWPDEDTGPGCRLPYYRGGTIARLDPVAPLPDTTTTTTVPPTTIQATNTTAAPHCDPEIGCPIRRPLDIPSLADSAQIQITGVLQNVGAPPGGGELRSITLHGPDGIQATATNLGTVGTDVKIGANTARILRPTSDHLVVLLSAPPGSTLGATWSLTAGMADPASTVDVSPTFASRVSARVVESSELTAGAVGTATIELVGADGKPLAAATAAEIQATASFPAASDVGSPIAARDGARLNIDIPASATETDADEVSVNVELSSSQPVRFDVIRLAIPIARPEYPSVVFPTSKSGLVRPGVVDTPGKITIPYQVRGPGTGSGCVTPKTTKITNAEGPSATAAYTDPQRACLNPGQTLDQAVTLDISKRVAGRTCTNLTFALEGTAVAATRSFDQAVCFRAERGSTWWTKALAVLMAMLGLVPLVVLGVLNRWNGRLAIPPMLGVATSLVRVDKLGITRTDGLPLLTADAFTDAGIVSGQRTLSLQRDRLRIEARAITVPRSSGRGRPSIQMLFAGPRSYLVSAQGPIVAGVGGDLIHAGPVQGPVRLPSDLDGVWVVEPRPDSRPGSELFAEVVAIRIIGRGSMTNALSDGIYSVVAGAVEAIVPPPSSPDTDYPFDL